MKSPSQLNNSKSNNSPTSINRIDKSFVSNNSKISNTSTPKSKSKSNRKSTILLDTVSLEQELNYVKGKEKPTENQESDSN